MRIDSIYNDWTEREHRCYNINITEFWEVEITFSECILMLQYNFINVSASRINAYL